MRIAALAHYYVPQHMAGSETMLHAMLAHLTGEHDVHAIVTDETGEREQVDGVTVHRGTDPDALLDALRPDIIVTHHQSVYRARRAQLRAGARLAVIAHNDFPATFNDVAAIQPDLVVFNTEWVAAEYRRRHAPLPTSIVVHPPIDPERHKSEPGDKVTLINLNSDKGAGTFYALAEALPDVDFLGVVGAHGEQVIREAPNVEIMPHTSDPREIWKRTRILLAPSIYESYGMVTIEAAASGIPTIAHPTPGLCEALGDAGTFANRAILSEWIEHVTRLLKPTPWKAAAKAARTRSRELDPTVELASWADAIRALA